MRFYRTSSNMELLSTGSLGVNDAHYKVLIMPVVGT